MTIWAVGRSSSSAWIDGVEPHDVQGRYPTGGTCSGGVRPEDPGSGQRGRARTMRRMPRLRHRVRPDARILGCFGAATSPPTFGPPVRWARWRARRFGDLVHRLRHRQVPRPPEACHTRDTPQPSHRIPHHLPGSISTSRFLTASSALARAAHSLSFECSGSGIDRVASLR